MEPKPRDVANFGERVGGVPGGAPWEAEWSAYERDHMGQGEQVPQTVTKNAVVEPSKIIDFQQFREQRARGLTVAKPVTVYQAPPVEKVITKVA